MTNEEAGWTMVVALYYLLTYVVPAALGAAVIYGVYLLGKRQR